MIKLGKYRHYKGHEYEIIGTAIHSEALEDMIVYRELFGENRLWVRPAEMFKESVEINGKKMPRFEYIGE